MNEQKHDWINNDGINIYMISEAPRNQFYEAAIKDAVPGKNCIDIGFGTGLLSYIALKYNPKHITAYEINKERYELGKYLINKFGLQDKITLVNQKFDKATCITDEHDVIFHEVVGSRIWDDGLYLHFNNSTAIVPATYRCDFYAVDVRDDEFPNTYYDFDKDTLTEYRKLRLLNLKEDITFEQYKQMSYAERDAIVQTHDIVFKTGVDLPIPYEEEITRLVTAYVRDRHVNLEEKKKNAEARDFEVHDFEIYPEVSERIYNTGKLFMWYEINHAAKTLTISDATGLRTVPLTCDEECVQLEIDASLFGDRSVALVPAYTLKHNEHELSFRNTHWGPSPQVIVAHYPKKNATIKQHLTTGILGDFELIDKY